VRKWKEGKAYGINVRLWGGKVRRKETASGLSNVVADRCCLEPSSA